MYVRGASFAFFNQSPHTSHLFFPCQSSVRPLHQRDGTHYLCPTDFDAGKSVGSCGSSHNTRNRRWTAIRTAWWGGRSGRIGTTASWWAFLRIYCDVTWHHTQCVCAVLCKHTFCVWCFGRLPESCEKLHEGISMLLYVCVCRDANKNVLYALFFLINNYLLIIFSSRASCVWSKIVFWFFFGENNVCEVLCLSRSIDFRRARGDASDHSTQPKTKVEKTLTCVFC